MKKGRPAKLRADEPTLSMISALARIGAMKTEAAAAFKVSEVTFHAFLKRHPEAAEAWNGGDATGRLEIRRKQHQTALGTEGAAPHAGMLQHLGNTRLGQKAAVEVQNVGKDGGPIQTTGEFVVKFVSANAARST